MANLNLLDIAKRNGSDRLVGLIEENLTYAPEIELLPVKTIRGTSYKLLTRTAFPDVGFRTANDGNTPGKSQYENQLIECFIFGGAIQVDKAVADADEEGAQAVQDIESVGFTKQAMIELGSQVIYGTSIDAKGFPGLQAIWTAFDAGLVVDAGGTTADTASSVYGVNLGNQGVQLVMGSGGSMELTDWRVENVAGGTAGTVYPAYVANMTSWIGLQVASKYAVGRLKDATADSTKGVTDAKLAELLSKYPIGYRPTHWLMNRRSAFQLQSSRSATTIQTGAKTSTATELWAPFPTESNGIPIVVTDSIGNTEALSA